LPQHQKQKSFASFLQKRRLFLNFPKYRPHSRPQSQATKFLGKPNTRQPKPARRFRLISLGRLQRCQISMKRFSLTSCDIDPATDRANSR
jgi:hypothetical protein